ncbi:hypothetical protein G6F51_013711 [Rhizopus arrhizus]|uniref:Uncharacterized protein n=1 Tax=Rhizopus oryzae TaxID=64495 RepID=A0A9P7C0R4_RHIOR|nr:hypothetical protein G6F51_013711 [Rhizopus arrhizus]
MSVLEVDSNWVIDNGGDDEDEDDEEEEEGNEEKGNEEGGDAEEDDEEKDDEKCDNEGLNSHTETCVSDQQHCAWKRRIYAVVLASAALSSASYLFKSYLSETNCADGSHSNAGIL